MSSRVVQLLVAVAVLVTRTDSAFAHQHELGFSVQPTFAALPAIADAHSQPALALSAGGGLGLEYYPVKYLALVFRIAYTHALSTTMIGQATFNNEAGFPRRGEYFFKQSTAFTSAALRLETPAWWIPFQFHVSVGAGAALVIQTERKLYVDGQDIHLPLADIIRVFPVVPVTTGIFVRVASQVRFDLDGTAFIYPQTPVLVGYGITLGLTFLFYT